jgi:hypothetical protein
MAAVNQGGFECDGDGDDDEDDDDDDAGRGTCDDEKFDESPSLNQAEADWRKGGCNDDDDDDDDDGSGSGGGGGNGNSPPPPPIHVSKVPLAAYISP